MGLQNRAYEELSLCLERQDWFGKFSVKILISSWAGIIWIFPNFSWEGLWFFYRYSFIQQQRILNYIIAEIKLNIEKETWSKSDLKQNRISLNFKRRTFYFSQTAFSPFPHQLFFHRNLLQFQVFWAWGWGNLQNAETLFCPELREREKSLWPTEMRQVGCVHCPKYSTKSCLWNGKEN